MTCKLVLTICLLLPTFLFSQTDIWDSKSKRVLEDDCDEKVFERVEEIPTLKVSNDNYADSIISFLKQRQITLINKKVVFAFIVTSKSEIFNFRLFLRTMDMGDVEQVEDAILKYHDLWMPARQNSHIVCSYVKLQLEFTKDKLNIRVFQ